MVLIEPEVNGRIMSAEHEKFFADLYERGFPLVAKFISSRNGTFEEARDIYQDALVIYFEKLQSGSIDISVSTEAYVAGIAKHLWFKRHKEERRFVRLASFEENITILQDDFVNAERLTSILERAGKKCLDLLQEFYYKNSALKDIAVRFGFRSAHAATVQKFKCLEKVRDHVKEKSLHYEDFTE
jgi:DNA-directed RNA polymerase specialized sigma24 family protein